MSTVHRSGMSPFSFAGLRWGAAGMSDVWRRGNGLSRCKIELEKGARMLRKVHFEIVEFGKKGV